MEHNTDHTPRRGGIFSSIIWLILLMIMGFALIYSLRMDSNVTKESYYDIINYFDNNKVTEYSLNWSSGKLTYVLEGEKEERTYTVPNVQLFILDVHDTVREYNKENPDKAIKMDYEAGTSSSWLIQIIPMVVLTIGLGFAFWWLMKKMNTTMTSENNRTMAFGKARLKSGEDEQRKTTFDDVAGVDEEKEDLKEIVEFLKNPEKFNNLGARIPKGVLLVGPPGTGKTLLARAVAGEADATFLSISGSDFVEMYVGVGASRVRDLFETAKKNVPAIIFIDEIDAVGRHRGAGMGGGHDEREQTLNQLLVEMDGFGTNIGVIIIAATNRPDILDPALLRPGRFDRQVTVNYPDVRGREAILRVHAKDKPIAPDVSLDEIARATGGFTGADLENLLNEAALLAARRSKRALTRSEIEEATIKVVVGTEKKSKKINDKEKKLTAYHEAGHAVTNFFLDTLDPVHQISIIPRGMAGGFTMSLPKEDKSYVSKQHMLDELVSLLGGRVAEALILGDISTGASNDIERATGIARNMITKYGMSEKLGPISYGSENDEVFLGKNYNHMRNYSEDTASAIDKEIYEVMSKAYDRASELLSSHVEKLHLLAEFLMRFEKIDGAVFEKLMTEDKFSLEDYEAELAAKIKEAESKKKPVSDEEPDSNEDKDGGSDGDKGGKDKALDDTSDSSEVEPVADDISAHKIAILSTDDVTLSEAELELKKQLEAELERADAEKAAKEAADKKAAEKAAKEAADKKAADEAAKKADKKADKKSADKKATDKKALDKKATDKKTDKKSAEKLPADTKASDKKSSDKKSSDEKAKSSEKKSTSKKSSKGKRSSKNAQKKSFEDVFDGSGVTTDDIKPKAIPLVTSSSDETADEKVKESEVLMPNEPFVQSEDKVPATLPGMEETTEDFNNESLNIGSFINNMTNYNSELEELKAARDNKLRENSGDSGKSAETAADDEDDFNYEEELAKGSFTENDEIYALYELLKQTRDFGDDGSTDDDWKKKLNDDE